METPKVVWLRPATLNEEYFELGYTHNSSRTYYTLHLSSSRVLGHDLLKKAFAHLFRHVGLLRVSLARREGRLWLREMPTCHVDLQEVKDGVVEEEEEKLMSHTYNDEGPLWCVRVIRPGTPPPLYLQRRCADTQQEHEQDFSNYCIIILGFHHTLSDGHTNLEIITLLMNLLDDLSACRIIDDEERHFGEHIGSQYAHQLYEEEKNKLLKDPELHKRRHEEVIESCKTRPLLLQCFPVQNEARTITVNHIISKPATEAVIQRCKAERVSFNSALVGAINVALIKLLEGKCPVPLGHNIAASHDVNIRRYYPDEASRCFGNHIPIFGFRFPFMVSKALTEDFWQAVTEYDKNFKTALEKRQPLEATVLRLLQKPIEEIFKNYMVDSADPDYYYTISNVGNVTRKFVDADNISLLQLNRCSSLRAKATFMCFYVHTFRGCLNINLAYSTRFMNRESATRLCHLVETVLATESSKHQ